MLVGYRSSVGVGGVSVKCWWSIGEVLVGCRSSVGGVSVKCWWGVGQVLVEYP